MIPLESHELLDYWNNYHSRPRKMASEIDRVFDNITCSLVKNNEAKVLDLGCGSGEYFAFLSSLSKNIVACDVSKIALKKAEKNTNSGRIKLINNEPDCIPLADETVDLIILSKVFSTLMDKKYRLSILRNISRLLAPQGKLLLVDFVYNQIWENLYETHTEGTWELKMLFPRWSEIGFIHYDYGEFDRIFSPMRRIYSKRIDLISCQGNSDRGYLAIYQK